jgi:hypothetical protein
MRRSTVAVGTLLLLLLAGCSSSPDEAGPERSPSSTTPTSPVPTGTASSSKPTTPGSPTDSGTTIPAWVKVMRQPVDGQHLVTQQRKYVVTRGSDEAGVTTVTDRSSRKVVVKHTPATGFVAQSPVVIDDHWALIEDIRSDGPDPQLKVFRYDLSTGRAANLAGLPPVSEPEIGAYDGTFAYSTTDAKNRSCLIVADLATLEARTVTCVADPGYLADPVVSADTVTFSEITAPETAGRCKRLWTAALSGGPARQVPAATKCIQWSGASLRGATVWSEVAATDPDQYQSKAYVRTSADSPARPLGTVVTDTILACGNWILWENRSVSGGKEAYQINRWRPGLEQPQRIYTSPAGAALTPLTCQNDTVYVETAYLSSSPTYTETISAAV